MVGAPRARGRRLPGSAGAERAAGFDAVVIGGGHAGLLAAKALGDAGFEAVVVEAGQVGQSWRDRYAELRLITTREQSTLAGMPWPAGTPRWPSGADVARYLEAFVAEHGLSVHASTAVHRVAPDGRSRWRVECDGGTVSARFVVLATGRHRVPQVPAAIRASLLRLGTKTVHSSAFADAPRSVATALVVGAGASGTDAARILAGAGARVFHAVRRVPFVLPERVLGVAFPPLAARMSSLLPPSVLDGSARAADVGRPRAWRRLSPNRLRPSELLEKGSLPGLDRGYVRAVCRDQVVLVHGLAVGCAGCAATRWDDGTSVTFRPDLAVLATGYREDWRILSAPLRNQVAAEGRRGPLTALLPGIGFVGFSLAPEGQFIRAAAECRVLAEAWSKEVAE